MFNLSMNSVSKRVIWGCHMSLGLFLSGCGDTGALLDGDATVTRFALKMQSPAAAMGLTLGTDGEISNAKVTIKSIELWLPEGRGCDDSSSSEVDERGSCEQEGSEESSEDKIKIQGPFVFDLLTGDSTPPLSDFKIPSGVYKRIRLKAAEDVNPSVDVTVGFGELAVLQISLNSDDEIDMESAEGFQVQEGTINSIVAEVDLSAVFAPYDLVACSADGLLHEVSGLNYLIDEVHEAQGACAGLEEDLEDAIFRESRVSCDQDDEDDNENETEDESEDD